MQTAISSRVVLVVMAFVAATTGLTIASGSPAVASMTKRRPNILFVLTDDLDRAELRYMPHTEQLIAGGGATFDHYFISNSLCCPSRVTTLRGQYAHNTGVWSNGGSNGGFERAFSEGLEQDTVATRLSGSGYRTALVGKYLNGYPNTVSPTYQPPGWTTFVTPSFGTPYSEYHYTLNDDGRLEFHGSHNRDYGTGVYMRRTEHFVKAAVHAKTPFFAYLAVYAPHQPATPARQDKKLFAHARVPRTAAYNQRDVHDMPRFIRELPRFSSGERAAIDDLYRLRIRSLQAVDRGVATLVHTLRVSKQLDNTYIVFTSDNGFHLGQHRLPAGKQTAYDTDTHVPLLIRGPGITAGSHVAQLTGNVDLAPTFEAMAGVKPPSFTDGRSLLGLADGAPNAGRHWRTAYLVEHRNEDSSAGPPAPRRRSLPLEPADPDQGGTRRPTRPWPRAHGHLREPRDQRVLARHSPIPNYDAVRTQRYLYVAYANGDRELYDTQTDPGEVHNLAGTMPTLQHALAARVASLRQCRASGCRIAEARHIPSGAQ